MSGFTLAVMSALLGASSFAMGMVPLTVVLSRSAMSRLTCFGSGLLLGAGLGIIIPEGVEAVIRSKPENSHTPTTSIALSLLAGFTFMLITEQLVSSHDHTNSHQPVSPSSRRTGKQRDAEFDTELGELEREEGPVSASHSRSSSAQSIQLDSAQDSQKKAYPLTLGLVLHALADGLALGSSILSGDDSAELSLIVFLALIIHKAPTALALTTSLMANSLPRSDCKKHAAIFSSATPIGALVSYTVLSFLGTTGGNNWTGIAMLVSGGSFLYVATVLQNISPHSSAATNEDDIGHKTKILFTVLGMFVPICISSVVGHGHE